MPQQTTKKQQLYCDDCNTKHPLSDWDISTEQLQRTLTCPHCNNTTTQQPPQKTPT